ncbi:MAG: TlpA family protein disulfide reductase [Deltaproteobacteria bacterium]|nr:TlpA family protein disulfide reductase [Deltaproteobacteria bacterium]
MGSRVISWHGAAAALALAVMCAGMTCRGTDGAGAASAVDGDPAAMWAFRFERLGGGTLTLSELPSKVVIVCFFTTWADAGILQAKALSNLFERESGRGLGVVGVAMDLEKDASVGPFVRQFKIAFPVVFADEAVLKGTSPFGNISTVPASYIFDGEGRLLGVWTGVMPAKELESLMERHL